MSKAWRPARASGEGIHEMMRDGTLRGAALAWCAGLAIGVLLLAHQVLQVSDVSMLGLALNNAAHTPFFIVLTLLVHSLGFSVAGLRFLRRPLVLVLVMAAIGAATEVPQAFTGRSASIEDWARDMLGTLAAVSFIQALGPRAQPPARRAGMFALGGILMAFGFVAVFGVLERHHRRDDLVPELLPLDPGLLAASARIRGTWRVETGSEPHLRLELDASRFPGLTLREPFPDWRNYNSLVIEGRSATGENLALTLRVETFTDRGMGYMREVVLTGERREHRLPLHELAAERGNVRNLFLYAEEIRPGDTLILYGIRLE